MFRFLEFLYSFVSSIKKCARKQNSTADGGIKTDQKWNKVKKFMGTEWFKHVQST